LAFSLAAEAGYLLFLLKQSSAKPNRRPAMQVAMWLSAVALGTLLGSVQFLPTVVALRHSVRQSGLGEITPGSMHPLNLIQLVAPYLFQSRVVGQNTHELGLYIGAIPLALAILGAANGLRLRRFRPLVIVSIVAIFLSLV